MGNAVSDFKYEISEVQPCVKKLQVEIAVERVNAESEKRWRELTKRAHVQGFRPGKAPRAILEKMYADSVLGEVGEHLIRESFDSVVEESKLEVFGDPTFEQVKVEKGKPISYAALVETMPQVTVPDSAGWEFEREVVRVDPAEIESVFKSLKDAHAELVPLEGRGAQDGDHIFLDFAATIDGKEEPKLTAKAQQMALSSSDDGLFADFHKNLLGVKAGDEKEFTVKLSKQYPDPAMAEKDAVFKVKVAAVKEKKLPELTDGFVAEHTPYKTVDEMRKGLAERAEEREKQRGDEGLRRKVLAKFREVTSFQLPPKMVAQYTEMYANRLLRQSQEWGLDLQGQPDFDRAKFTQGASAKGEEWARDEVIIESIAKANKLEPDRGELDRLQNEYAEYLKSDDKNTRYNAALFTIKEALQESVFKFLYGKMKVTDKIVDKVEEGKENN